MLVVGLPAMQVYMHFKQTAFPAYRVQRVKAFILITQPFEVNLGVAGSSLTLDGVSSQSR